MQPMIKHTNNAGAQLSTLMLVSPLVIASRLAEFWMTAAAPTHSSRREASSMVTEKMAALGESALALNLAVTKLTIDNTTAVMTGVARATHNDADDIFAAALRPYAARVTANHARLSR